MFRRLFSVTIYSWTVRDRRLLTVQEDGACDSKQSWCAVIVFLL